MLLSVSIWEKLESWDQWLFIQLNSRYTNPVFDFILPYFRDSVFWAPLYIFMLVFVTVNYGKKGWWWSLGFLCMIAMADMTSSRIFKEVFERLRPCQDPFFFQNVRLLLKHCSSSYSFTSSHAANHFGIAVFMYLTAYRHFGRWIYLFFLWALFVSYAQVYVGVHYPLDILGGWLIGTLAAILTATVFNKKAVSFNTTNTH
jgi:membrane-associated phospholipid phosphatase